MSKEIDALKLFNVKAEEILRTGFVRYLNERKPFKISIKGEGSEARPETILPYQGLHKDLCFDIQVILPEKDRCPRAVKESDSDQLSLSFGFVHLWFG